ncbi:unnamed protein product [Schistosoma rodhaini]|uniref:DUF5641 domain-containing protein n=1 Tax=Schistosoma rodhaini TaxID=6188 RepID=A0AA85GHI8_9TREM|nr:unnamed protein product [Schistosoma rodhaini]
MSMKNHKTDQIPELSPHYSDTHNDDQFGGNSCRMDPLLELELAKIRLTQTEREIELEHLRQKGREHYNQAVAGKAMYKSTFASPAVDIPPEKDWITMISRALDLPKREIIRFNGNPMNYWSFIRNFEDCFDERVGFRSRLNYLIQYCDGEAKATIVHCALLEPEEGYRKALELLEEAFGQKHIVAHAFIDKMLNIPAIKGTDPDGLRRLSREMHVCELTLTQMNYVSDLNSTKTIECMFLKLPLHLQREWVKVASKILKTGREPLFKDLCEFVKEQSDIANTRYGLLVSGDISNRNQRQSVAVTKRPFDSEYKARVSFANTSESVVSPHVGPRTLGLSCLLCNGNHPLDQCETFRDKDVSERIEFVLRKKLCNVCLKANHIARNCRAPRSCAVDGCGWRHHTLLHRKREEQSDSNSNVHINTQLCTEESAKHVQGQVAFAIVPVLVKNGERSFQTCAFLDSGSDASLITEDLAIRLGLEGESKTLLLKTLDSQSTFHCKEVQIEVSSLDSSSSFRIPKVWTVERLPLLRRTVPTTSQMVSWSHLRGVTLPTVDDEDVKVLIGCNVPEAHEIEEKRVGKSNEPYAIKTPLGWTLFGPYIETTRNMGIINYLSSKEELEARLDQLYKMDFEEDPNHRVPMSVEDRKALDTMSKSIQLVNGHYQIALPWRHQQSLPNNRKLAMSRLISLRNRFIRDQRLHKEYINVMAQYVEKGYAEKASGDFIRCRVWYLPHHPVFHPKKPNKLRIVFDCAAQYAGTSLNKNLYSGPDLVNNLVDVFTRFRRRPIGLMADIEAMFHQVIVPSQDRDALRFLWWPQGDIRNEPETYRMKVHLFGATSSPSCATFALQRTILDNEAKFLECIIQTAKEQFYVDDLLTSVDTLEEAKLVYSQLKEMLRLGGFNLTKWASNNVELIKFISEGDHIDRNVDICLSVEENERILGKEWNVRTDNIFRMYKLDVTPARKTILSYVASIFDPDGFIAPIVLPAKLISQDACRLNLSCDELPRECSVRWNCMLRGMKRLSKLLLPRCLVLGLYKPLPTQIYRFVDATEFAYGVVAYARFKDVSCQVHRSFLLAKFRVAKPKIKAPCYHNPKTTLKKPKKRKVTKPKVKTPKKPKVTLTKKSVNKTVKKQTAHIRRGIVHGVGKDAVVRVVNKSKDGSDKFKKANANRRQIMCSWNQNKIANALLERGCEWRFKLPRASHRGSVWGRIIKSIRRILQSLLFQKVLTDESLEMFLIEIEGIINNRLFVKLVNDCDDLDALTPNKLLLVYRGVSFDEAQMSKTCLYNERWKEAEKLANLFWNRWLREYLPTLQARSKWLDMKMNLQPGDLLLVNNIGSPRNLWLKAIVRRVNYGPNGRVRTVRLKRSAGICGNCLFGEADYIDVTVMKPGCGVRLGGNVSYVHN